MPFYREILMFHGICSVSKPSCANILRKGAGSAITIVIGGAAESLSAHPGTADLTLKKRFGFIKMAIREGADLVPVFSFGENDVSASRCARVVLTRRFTTSCSCLSRGCCSVLMSGRTIRDRSYTVSRRSFKRFLGSHCRCSTAEGECNESSWSCANRTAYSTVSLPSLQIVPVADATQTTWA